MPGRAVRARPQGESSDRDMRCRTTRKPLIRSRPGQATIREMGCHSIARFACQRTRRTSRRSFEQIVTRDSRSDLDRHPRHHFGQRAKNVDSDGRTPEPRIDVRRKALHAGGHRLAGTEAEYRRHTRFGLAHLRPAAAVVCLSFAGIFMISKVFRLQGDIPLLLASGFSICGASAIGAMAAARRSETEDTVLPIAMVTLCGTAAIGVLPLLMQPLSLSAVSFGQWVGLSVHDVGQVVATAQTAGTAALGAAVIIKLTRVLLLTPIVAGAVLLRKETWERGRTRLPAILPLFIIWIPTNDRGQIPRMGKRGNPRNSRPCPRHLDRNGAFRPRQRGQNQGAGQIRRTNSYCRAALLDTHRRTRTNSSSPDPELDTPNHLPMHPPTPFTGPSQLSLVGLFNSQGEWRTVLLKPKTGPPGARRTWHLEAAVSNLAALIDCPRRRPIPLADGSACGAVRLQREEISAPADHAGGRPLLLPHHRHPACPQVLITAQRVRTHHHARNTRLSRHRRENPK